MFAPNIKKVAMTTIGTLFLSGAFVALAMSMSADPLMAWEESYRGAQANLKTAEAQYTSARSLACKIEQEGATLKLYMESKGDLVLDEAKKANLRGKLGTCGF
jgi:hypothetical protein